MFNKEPKILGTGEFTYKEDGRIGVIMRTKITMNTMYIDMCATLQQLGFIFHSWHKNKADISLPIDWKHIRMDSSTEIIADEFGRIRVTINTKTNDLKILQRFGYFMYIARHNEVVIGIEWGVTDRDVVIESGIVDTVQFYKSVEIDGSEEKVIDNIQHVIIAGLDQDFPGWDDPLAYWE